MAKRNGGSPFIVALIDPPISNKSSPFLIISAFYLILYLFKLFYFVTTYSKEYPNVLIVYTRISK
jgi:hypothetical protein